MLDIKQFLKQAYRLDELIKCNQEELRSLKELATSITGMSYSDGIHSGSVNNNANFVNILIKISAIEEEIKKDIDNLLAVKIEIRNKINTVKNPDERLLLKLKYMNFLTWEQIKNEMHMSERSIHRLHSSALFHIK